MRINVDSPGPAIVTLITDFGWQDAYVGQLKGRLLHSCRHILPLDLNHAIPPWDIAAAARCLYDSYSFFPLGSIHLVVVDPGVGSERRLLAATGQGHFFVCPDNGILSHLLEENRIEKAREISRSADEFLRISPTFHGRDILAPAAARLACGRSFDALGPALALNQLIRLEKAEPSAAAMTPNKLKGQVLSVDQFGNIRTSFHPLRDHINLALLSGLRIKTIVVSIQVATYAEAPADTPCFLIDSGGYIEVAVNQGNAAQAIGCQPGDPVRLQLKAINSLHKVNSV